MNDKNNSSLLDAAWDTLPAEIHDELIHILNYWEQHARDLRSGGFAGQIDPDNKVQDLAPKGSVLHSRILWSFSAAFLYTQAPLHLELATRAYPYILELLSDPE